MKKQHFLAAMVSACALLFGTSSPAQTTGSGVPGMLVPVADFFRTAKLIDPELSPDGRFVAVGAGADNGRVQLVVLDLANPAASKVAVSLADADVIQIAWVNSERLVFSVRDLQQSDRNMAPGLWAVNRDGKEFKELIKAHGHILSNDYQARIDRRLSWEWELHSTLRDGSADVIVEAPTFDNTWDVTSVKIGRLDTQTGRLKYLDAGAPAHSMGWVLDRDGQPAMVTTQSKGRVASYVRNGSEWKLWEEADSFARTISNPYWVGPNQQLLVTAPTPSGTAALYEVDPHTLKRAEQPLVKLSGYDFGGQLIYDDQAKRLLGVHFETDAPGTAWFDSSMQELQKEIDKLLPATVNRISCKRCVSVPVALVSAQSDRSPPAYYIYRRDTKALEPLGASRPWIKPAQMGLRDLYRFEARDKRMIPALVTQPAGKSNIKRPAVVLVHGGPFVRGNHWAWESEAQFLASRGYVVIEPDFRGSTGYGFDHFQAGWKQWGLSMQDDVADSVAWAVKQGWVDPGRVCIAGASYGGYAVLMGLIKDPDLYQCGINWVGVTDINLLYDITWSDFSEEWKRYGMPTLVGDQVKDAQQLKNTSPLEQAPRLKRPLLMAYGGLDQRVPIRHGTAFRDAVMKNNKDVEWVVYPREGHGWFELETNVDFWTRVEKFLDRNIGLSGVSR